MPDVRDLFRAQGAHLLWRRLDDAQVTGISTGQPIEPDKAYFVVRLTEMYLGRSRTLWRKSPCAASTSSSPVGWPKQPTSLAA